MMENTESVAVVRDMLYWFNEGNPKRDLSVLDDFMRLFVEDKGLEVIGFSRVFPGDRTWRIGERGGAAVG